MCLSRLFQKKSSSHKKKSSDHKKTSSDHDTIEVPVHKVTGRPEAFEGEFQESGKTVIVRLHPGSQYLYEGYANLTADHTERLVKWLGNNPSENDVKMWDGVKFWLAT